MVLTVLVILSIAAFALTIASAARPALVPLWIAVLVISIIELLRVMPLGK